MTFQIYLYNSHHILIPEGAPSRLLFDKTISVRQIDVIEEHGLLICRTDKGEWSQLLGFVSLFNVFFFKSHTVWSNYAFATKSR